MVLEMREIVSSDVKNHSSCFKQILSWEGKKIKERGHGLLPVVYTVSE